MKKKGFSLLFAIPLLLISCGLNKNARFNDELLKDYGISDLPQLSTEKTWANSEGSAISASVNGEEYSSYVGWVVDYFLLKDSVKNFGERVQKGLIAEMLPDYILVPLTTGQSYADSIILVCSFTDELAESGGSRKLLQNAFQVSFKREESSSWGIFLT